MSFICLNLHSNAKNYFMIKIIKLLSLLLVFVVSSCSVVPMSSEAKARYIKEEKRKADAYALAELDCQKVLIEDKLTKTRADRSLYQKKSTNFKLTVDLKKYIFNKYNGDTIEIKKLDQLKTELSKELETCGQAGPLVVDENLPSTDKK